MKKFGNKGITLVALVVTIIVLIILAGVSISLILGQDGVVQKAKEGRDSYEDAARIENEQLANVDAFAMTVQEMTPSTSTVTGEITNMTDGELEISATVNLEGNIDFTKTKYVFTTSNSPLGTNDESLYKDGTVEQSNNIVEATKAAGTYYLHVLAIGEKGSKTEIISENTATSQGKKDFDYTGDVQEIELTPGKYKLEVWGAQGGTSDNQYAKGGYSLGNLTINSKTTIYAYVGQKGKKNDLTNQWEQGGWNGGGGSYTNNNNNCAYTGGGATDFCIVKGTISLDSYGRTLRSNDSYLSRIIVAGAGGGWYTTSYDSNNYGGGTTGGAGGGYAAATNTSSSSGSRTWSAATQTSAGRVYQYTNAYDTGGSDGGFGYGTSFRSTHTGNTTGSSAGGGWYGGSAGAHGNGGGGSGYVYTSSTASNYPSGCLLNESYYLTDAQTIAGNTSFTAPNGSNETGHSGNGYARITALD